jgi:hypothetical protein
MCFLLERSEELFRITNCSILEGAVQKNVI